MCSNFCHVLNVDIKKGKKPKLISLLTNDFDMTLETIVAIYRRRWQIESLFYVKHIVMRSESTCQ